MMVFQCGLFFFETLLIFFMDHHCSHFLAVCFACLPVNSSKDESLLGPNHRQVSSQKVRYFFQSGIHPKYLNKLPKIKQELAIFWSFFLLGVVIYSINRIINTSKERTHLIAINMT